MVLFCLCCLAAVAAMATTASLVHIARDPWRFRLLGLAAGWLAVAGVPFSSLLYAGGDFFLLFMSSQV